MIDVKKLITVFLILAIGVSSLALIFSHFASTLASSANTSNPAQIVAVALPPPPVGNNAFLPQTQSQFPDEAYNTSSTDDLADASESSTDAIAGDPNNLTGILSNDYLNGLLATNPSGPQLDANGNPTMNPPDDNAIVSEIASSSAFQNIQIPDWDTEAGEIPTIIASSSSPAAISSYATALGTILYQNFTQTNLQNELSLQNPSLDVASSVNMAAAQALQDISALTVPAPAANFQKSLVKLLVYTKNTSALAENMSSDPLKSSIILQAEQPKYLATIQDFQTQIQNAKTANLFSMTNSSDTEISGPLALFNAALGIPVAHAQFGGFVVDLITESETTATITQILLEWAEATALEVLKEIAVQTIQTTVLKWVQGNGTPRFVQNWARTFTNTFVAAANGAVNQITPNLSPSFRGTVNSMLQTNGSPQQNIQSNIDSEYATLGTTQQNFYNDFDNGGMAAYLDLFQPDNNQFGALMDTQDAALAAGSNQANAVQSQNIASNGFTSGDDEACDDGSDPINGTHLACSDGSTPDALGNCDDGEPAYTEANAGSCADGSEPDQLEPGEVTSQAFNSGLDAQENMITNDNNPAAGLLGAFLSSFLNSLMNSLVNKTVTTVSGVLP